MNLYLLSLLIYSLMILPVSVHFRLRLGRQSGYRLEFRAAGLPLRRTGPPEDPDGETPVSRKKGLRKLLSADAALLRTLTDRTVLRRFLHMLHLRKCTVLLRLSMEDAALNALCFCGLRTLTETLRLTGALPGVFCCRMQADFSQNGTEALLEGIVGLRLGSLIPTMALMGSVYLRSRRQYAQDGRTAALS